MTCSGMADVGSPSSFRAEPLQGVVRKCEADASGLHGDLPGASARRLNKADLSGIQAEGSVLHFKAAGVQTYVEHFTARNFVS